MKKKTVPSKDLVKFLKKVRVKLDCGHHYTVHHLSNTLIVLPNGTTRCHECGY